MIHRCWGEIKYLLSFNFKIILLYVHLCCNFIQLQITKNLTIFSCTILHFLLSSRFANSAERKKLKNKVISATQSSDILSSVTSLHNLWKPIQRSKHTNRLNFSTFIFFASITVDAISTINFSRHADVMKIWIHRTKKYEIALLLHSVFMPWLEFNSP